MAHSISRLVLGLGGRQHYKRVADSAAGADALGRPKEHHIFDVLHWIKASFKKHALDEVKEVDCLNKEAFR